MDAASSVGHFDPRTSRVGFGCAPIGGHDYGRVSDADSINAIRAAVFAGITLFDTADVYGLGRSERVLSDALGGERHRFIIATKGGVAWDAQGRTRKDISPAYIAAAIDRSLQRLRLDTIPLYQLHWPDGRTPLVDAVGVLARAQEEGKIQRIGVCNMTVQELADANVLHRIDTMQFPYSLLERQYQTTIASCSERGVTVLCYNVLAQGLLTGKHTRASQFMGTDLRRRSALFREPLLTKGLSILDVLATIARRKQCTTTQLAIAWVIRRWPNAVALTGIKTATQADENASAMSITLDPDELTLLEGVING